MKKNYFQPSNKTRCRVCGGPTSCSGFLYRCLADGCSAAHWDKYGVLKQELDDPGVLQQVLEDALVPNRIKGKVGSFVYVLRLRKELNAVYVGMTSRHPYERYLNHIRGHKASKHAKRRATAIVTIEGPMTEKSAEQRERSLAEELRSQGNIVYGGH